MGVLGAVSSLFAILCFLRLFQIWSLWIFFYQGTRKGTNMFNGPANLRKFHRREHNKSCSKDLYFLCQETFCNNFAKFYIQACIHYQICCNLWPFGNLSHCFFFLVDLFIRHRRPMNIMGAVAGNTWFPYIKTVLC